MVSRDSVGSDDIPGVVLAVVSEPRVVVALSESED